MKTSVDDQAVVFRVSVASSYLQTTRLVDYQGTSLYNDSMKVRDIIKRLEQDGWYPVSIEGSHRQYKHPTKKGRVTVAGKLRDDVRKGTLNSILKQAGLKPEKKG